MARECKATKELISARTVLWHVVFAGFAVNYMIRLNLNIAIVSMVKYKTNKDVDVTSSECFSRNSTSVIAKNINLDLNSSVSDNFTSNISLGSLLLSNETNLNDDSIVQVKREFEGFEWNEVHQGVIIGAYFWFHWLTQIPGGILAQKYGTKLVFGAANFAGVVFSFFIPVASYQGYEWLVFVRAVQGLLTGFSWPAMHHMAAKWVPPNERSSFVSSYLGSSIGAALTYPMCGWIIDEWGWEWVFYTNGILGIGAALTYPMCGWIIDEWGWEWVFYTNGILGTIWYIWWLYCVFDSPEQHPRISEAEKEYIISRLEQQSKPRKKAPVPWKKILPALPIWMNILAQWGGIWGFFTLMNHAPQYFKLVHGWDIKATGLLSGMPHLLRFGFSLLFSQFGDYLLKSNKMSRTNVRKLAVTHCCTIQGVFMLCLAYSGCNYTAAIIFLSAAVAVNGAVSTGPLASLVDISPNYASIGLGMCNTVVALVGVFIPTVVSYITYGNQTDVGQWQKVFWIATLMLTISGVLYCIFSRSNVQPWNFPKEDYVTDEDSELKTLKSPEKNNVSVEIHAEVPEKP
ncbi:Major Facilitator Superfamily [Popillia japonica]|uniref:Major Facilitator Superfamily n=1 Tax=Popillia japonica TaxID=7064 RepID=A0AAW1MGU2_POPJA